MKRIILGLILTALAACASPGQEDDPGATGPTPVDPTTYVQAPGSHHVLGEGVAVGQRLVILSSGPEFRQRQTVAIVGEGPGVWHLELEGSAYEGYVMGLVVEKQGGRIDRAVLGKPGEAGEPIEVPDGLPPGEQGPEDGVLEEVTIGIGSFASRKVVRGSITSWSGTERELEGVLLRVDDPANGPYELERMPEFAEVTVSGTPLQVLKLHYSNGNAFWDTDDPVVRALQPYGFGGKGRLKTTITIPVKNQTEVIERTTDASPQLRWP